MHACLRKLFTHWHREQVLGLHPYTRMVYMVYIPIHAPPQ